MRAVRSLKLLLILALSVAATNVSAQIGIVWQQTPPYFEHTFLGSANMDSDPGEELVFVDYSAVQSDDILILDGSTGNVDYYASFDYLWIGGYDANGDMTSRYSPFCDVNGDGIKEIHFWGRVNSPGDPLQIFIVGTSGAVSAVGEPLGFTQSPVLSQNYPNPFNPTTTIRYEMTSRGHAQIDIYSVTGERVRRLLNQEVGPGEHTLTWDGTNDSGQSVASGAYFYQLRVEDYISSKKALLLK